MAEFKDLFIHHVFFWLKNPGNKQDYEQLLAGLRKLAQAKTIMDCHIGKPAETNRQIIERSYAVSWCVFFRNPADQEIYQTDPIHLKFVDECSHLWTKVVVHDSVDA